MNYLFHLLNINCTEWNWNAVEHNYCHFKNWQVKILTPLVKMMKETLQVDLWSRPTWNRDEEWEVRANATARADWVILHSVITLITVLSRLCLYLDWSLLSGIRLHPGEFISDFLSSFSWPLSPSCPLLLPPFFLSLTFLCCVCPSPSPVIELELYAEGK